MISVLVVTHDGFGNGIKKTVEAILGPQEQFDIKEFDETQSVESFSEEIESIINAMYTDLGMMIFVDLLGATPANVTASLLSKDLVKHKKLSIITGVNIPTLFESLLGRESEDDLSLLTENAISKGKEGILNMVDLLR
ncbi:PTS sugar transporter subunit IIA [Enterococcus sp. AZ072]|uniref:PTS sugar transporter subunit IIA n=1 Tax=unclassified Enterococcus TaxID=2608891 RepID=UPI003D2A97D6